MKVLIIGHGDFFSGGKTAIFMEALLASGHEVETRQLGDMQPGTYNVTFDECREYQSKSIQAITATIERQLEEIKPIRQPKGPRNRWGKVK